MSLTSFINWLFTNITKVIEWFGDRFDIYVDILRNINAYISAVINPIRDYLLGKISDYYNTLVGWVTSNYNNLIKWMNDTVSNIYKSINSLQASITGSVTGTINSVIEFINRVSQYATDLVNSLRVELQAWVNQQVKGLIEYAIQPLQPVLRLVDNIDKIITFFRNDVQDKVRYLLDTVVPFMVSFTSNPVGFIFDILSASLISTACYFIALAIGTTASDMDITPPWKKTK